MGRKPTYKELEQRVKVLEEDVKRKTPSDDLKETYLQFKTLIQAIPDIVYFKDKQGRNLVVNKAFEKLVGLSQKEIIGKTDDQVLPPDLAERCVQSDEAAMRNGKPLRFEEKTLLPDGTIIFFDTIKSPILDKEGRPKGLVGISRDITERKQVEAGMRQSEEQHRLYFENVSDVIFVMDTEFRIINLSPSIERILGYKPHTLIGKTLQELDILNPTSLEKAFSDATRVLSGEKIPLSQYEFIARDGTIKFGEISATPLFQDGKVHSIVAVARDITERKQVENALKQSEEKYRTVLEANPDPVVVYDMDGNVKYFNPAFTRVFGWTIDECFGKSMDVFMPEETWPATRGMIQKVLSGESFSGIETRRYTKTGKILPVSISGAIYRDGDGNPMGSVINIRNISEQKGLEKQFQQAQKMEAIGTLAGGIAHDFNNLLMGIQGRTSLISLDITPDHPHFEHIQAINDCINSAVNLTKQLLGFARGGKYEVKPVDIKEIVNKSADMFGRTKKEINIHRRIHPEVWPVEVDQSQIEQVLLNIYVNAWQAMSGTGELYLETENVTLTDDDVQPYGSGPGNYVKISVTDTGVGMDETIQKKIFDPFFTTKERSRGTGLGLASAYGIIKSHGGIINAQSRSGEGATFNIYLPATQKEIVQEANFKTEVFMGTGTVLLVDDEDMIIDVGRKMLQHLGYEVLIAKSGEKAIEIYKKNQGEIDWVILDMIMPKMGGGNTYDKLKEINPDIKVLLSSGYSINGLAQKILSRGCDGFIQKPYNIKDLSQAIRKILNK